MASLCWFKTLPVYNLSLTDLRLVAGEKAEFDGPVDDGLSVVDGGRLNDVDVLVGELLLVNTTRSEIQQ